MMPDDCQEKLVEAIQSLPVLDDRTSTIEAEAKNLCMMASLAVGQEKPHLNKAGRSQTGKELQLLHDRCFFLYAHINNMHSEALAAMRDETGEDLRQGFMKYVGKISDAANAATSRPVAPSASGRRKNSVAASVTIDAAAAYKRLTGQNPARGFNHLKNSHTGHFVTFLEKVFIATGVKGSAASQAGLYLKQKQQGTIPKSRTFRIG
jgi:hypothetical protein